MPRIIASLGSSTESAITASPEPSSTVAFACTGESRAFSRPLMLMRVLSVASTRMTASPLFVRRSRAAVRSSLVWAYAGIEAAVRQNAISHGTVLRIGSSCGPRPGVIATKA